MTKKIKEPENVIVLQAPVEPPPGSTVIKNVTATRVEKFTEVVPGESQNPGAENKNGSGPEATALKPPVDPRLEEMNEPLDTGDIVRALIEQVDIEETDYVLNVYRLPKFDVDGKRGVHGTARKFLDRIDVSLDYLLEVKERYGGGTYQFFLLDAKRRIKSRWVEHIDGPPRIEENPAPLVPSLSVPQSPSSAAGLSQLIEFANTWSELRKLVMGDSPAFNPAPVQAAPIIVSGDEDSSDPEVTLILGLLNSNNPRAANLAETLIIKRYSTGNASMGDMLERLVEPFIPSIQMGVSEYFKKQMTPPVTQRGPLAAAQSAQTNSAADGVIAGKDPNGVTAATGDRPPDEETMSDESYLDLAENLMMLMGVAVHQPQTFDSMVAQAANLVIEYKSEHQEFADWIDSLLMMAPKGVLTSLVMLIPDAAPLRDEPEALRFVEQLQLKLKDATPTISNGGEQ